MERHSESIQLKFNCQEDLGAMSSTERGTFCGACQKEVIDFTSLSYSDIQRAKANETELYGMFLAEQIDPSLHPIELPKIRSWAFVSTILVSLNLGSVAAQSTLDPKVEQAQGASNAPKLSQEEAEEKMESGQHISVSMSEPTAANETEPEPEMTAREVKKRLRKYRKRVYWSKRFPFIHIKRIFRAGKFLVHEDFAANHLTFNHFTFAEPEDHISIPLGTKLRRSAFQFYRNSKWSFLT